MTLKPDAREPMVFWPEVFTNPNFNYQKRDLDKALADGLCGWGCCHLWRTIPTEFGNGMVKIYNVLAGTGIKNACESELRILCEQRTQQLEKQTCH